MPHALDIDGLVVKYGGQTALNGVSLILGEGRFGALLGPNGAGKSTLYSVLTHLVVPAAGCIRILGNDLLAHPRNVLAQIGVVFQDSTLDGDTSVLGNMMYFAALHGISPRAARPEIDIALEKLDLQQSVYARVRSLSGGQRRRVEIARAMLHRPNLLLLDEPTAGLDAASRAALTQHVHGLCKRDGVSVLWATHLVDEIDDDDDVIVLDRGEVTAAGLARMIRGDKPLSERFLELTSKAT